MNMFIYSLTVGQQSLLMKSNRISFSYKIKLVTVVTGVLLGCISELKHMSNLHLVPGFYHWQK